jgi:GDP-mannose 6-dehydrogenase
MKISVFGLGYVGSVSAGCLADLGHQVIGVDVNPNKVKMINAGQSPAIEKDIDRIIQKNTQAERLRAVTSAEEAVFNSDISLVCVGTPSSANGNLDLKFVERVCLEIGRALSDKASFHTVVIRSTILPGSTEEIVIPILEQASGYRAGKDFGIVFNPEFLREGTSVEDFYHPPFTIIGLHDPGSAEEAAKLYEGIDAPLLKVPLRVAEMIKYTNNCFHALKVAFANEIGRICKSQGIDSHQVMDIFYMDSKLNLSSYYLKPGYAFGGSCLPKDVRALIYNAHRLDQSIPVLEAILPSNEIQIRRGFEMISQTGYKKVGVLGFSFKAGTDDLRESPMVELIEMLIGKGYQVLIYDQNVSLAKLYGANREYIEQTIPHISTLMCNSIEEVLAKSEVVVIGNRASEFAPILQMVKKDQVIIDLVRIVKEQDHLGFKYQGICW